MPPIIRITGIGRLQAVYIVEYDDNPAPGVYIQGVFSTPQLAHAWIKAHPSDLTQSVVGYDVDAPEEV